ncbi:hypothetical protein ABZT49_30965 [Methylobacterium sp. EM32]|uniref:hypothetical protein n=1 Tax=Methylobacterium sp. EM32 TaxID=3163481 RepID=UPI0033A52434
MNAKDESVPGRWDWLQARIRPLEPDVEAALNELVPEPSEVPIEIPENWDWMRRVVGPLDDDFERAATEELPLPPDDPVEDPDSTP